MSLTCCWHVDNRPKWVGFLKNLVQLQHQSFKNLCLWIPGDDTNIMHSLLFSELLNCLWHEKHIELRRNECSVVCIFCTKGLYFQASSNMLTTCQNMSIMSVIFSDAEHLTFQIEGKLSYLMFVRKIVFIDSCFWNWYGVFQFKNNLISIKWSRFF